MRTVAVAALLGLSACASMPRTYNPEFWSYEALAEGYFTIDHPVAVYYHMSPIDVSQVCGWPYDDWAWRWGCASSSKDRCIVILPYQQTVGFVTYDEIRKHENAHCWGWEHK
jgi:hypothetical protein